MGKPRFVEKGWLVWYCIGMGEEGFIPLVVLFIAALVSATALFMHKDSVHPSVAPVTEESTPSPSSQVSVFPSPTPSSSAPKDLITASGSYDVSGETINYTFSFPKEGGEVTGLVSGLCSGTVSGKFDGGENGKIAGEVTGSCGYGFLQKDISLTYSGLVHQSKESADINWQGDVPIGPKSGTFTLMFNH